jgi:probable rRNA maturation factor
MRSSAGRPIEIGCRHPRLRLKPAEVAAALHRLDAERHRWETAASVLGRAGGRETLTIAFVTDAELARLHAQFLDDPTPTDVITFPAEPGFGAAGEICVSADAAARQPGRAFSLELTLYVVHGWLHLAGHDDLNPAAKRRMRRAERSALAHLRAARALPHFSLAPAQIKRPHKKRSRLN